MEIPQSLLAISPTVLNVSHCELCVCLSSWNLSCCMFWKWTFDHLLCNSEETSSVLSLNLPSLTSFKQQLDYSLGFLFRLNELPQALYITFSYPLTMLVAHVQLSIHCDPHHQLFSSVLLPSQLILSAWGYPAPGAELFTFPLTTLRGCCWPNHQVSKGCFGLKLYYLACHVLSQFNWLLVIIIIFSNSNCIFFYIWHCASWKGYWSFFPNVFFCLGMPNNHE